MTAGRRRAPAGGPALAPPQVLYVLKRFPRLSETFVLNEILGLEAAGVRVLVDVLLPAEDAPTHPELAQVRAEVRQVPRAVRLLDRPALRAHVAEAVRHPRRWAVLALRARRSGTWRRFVQAGLVAARIRSEHVSHVHAHFATAACEVASTAARLVGVTCSVTAHAKDIYHQDNAAQLVRRLAGTDTVVTVSAHNVAHLRAVLADDGCATEVRHIPNGVRLSTVPADPAAHSTLLCVARLVPKKGVDLLVEAAALLLARHPGLRVEIIGDGPLRAELAALIQRLGVGSRVLLLGPATSAQVSSAMERSRAVVLPCRVGPDGDRDGMPTVLVEALARGVPVVSTDIVGIAELVVDGETGLLVRPEDPAALAEALERVLADPALAARLGLAGRRLVGERFRPESSTAALVSAFRGGTDSAGGAR